MKLRSYIAKLFGGIKAAIHNQSQIAAVVRGVDERVGRQGAFGKRQRKNPFKGIACSNGSSYGLKFFRHVEGARDSRPTFPKRHRDQVIRKMFFDGFLEITPFRDSNYHPVSFGN